MNVKLIEWILRISIFGEFLGHGIFAIQGKETWVGWMVKLLGTTPETAGQLIFAVGVMDIIVALLVLIYPMRIILAWAALWGFWTALLRPIVGEPVWDFVERWANWGAPLALFFLKGRVEKSSDWFR